MITIEVILQLIKYFAVGVMTIICFSIIIGVIILIIGAIMDASLSDNEYVEILRAIIKVVGACIILIFLIITLGREVVIDMGW